jgi:trypsin
MHTRNAAASEGQRRALPPSERGASTSPPRPRRRVARRTLAWLAPLALLAAGCSEPNDGPAEPLGQAEQAIEGGVDEEGFFEVVQIIWSHDNDSSQCTGVVIAPDLVLTARHCVDGFEEPDPACREGKVKPANSALSVKFRVPGKEPIGLLVPPGSVRVPDAGCELDLALLRVPEMLNLRNEFWFRAASPRLDYPLEPGEAYSAIGFGNANAQGEGGNVLRQRPNLLVSCLGANCEAAAGALPYEWQGEAGVCKGDSGGPAFDAQGRVVGIASRSNVSDCGEPIYTSLFAWRDWLRDQALVSTRLGSYQTPPWAKRVADEGAGDGETPALIAGGRCSFGPSPPGGGAHALAALALGCAALGARRTSRREA